LSGSNVLVLLSLLLCVTAVLFWRSPEYYYYSVTIDLGRTPCRLSASPNGIRYSYQDQDMIVIVFSLPWWLICLVTSIAPGAWWVGYKRRKRHPPGLCPNCRYDLRATPDRCPECGHVPARAAKKKSSATENTEHTEEDQDIVATDEDR
jgi:hypothetical protein